VDKAKQRNLVNASLAIASVVAIMVDFGESDTSLTEEEMQALFHRQCQSHLPKNALTFGLYK